MAIKNFLIKLNKLKSLNRQAGVTLVEMLVVVGIIVLVTSVMMFNYSDFSTNVSVKNLTQEIALGIRKSQTYATSVRTIDGTRALPSDTFNGYGVSFSNNDNLANSNTVTPGFKQFILFADTDLPLAEGAPTPNPRSKYDTGESLICGDSSLQKGGECLESFGINTADRIDRICINSKECTKSNNTRVDITFRRPSPDAIICKISPAPITCNISYITIHVVSAKGFDRTVQVWNTGQISVE